MTAAAVAALVCQDDLNRALGGLRLAAASNTAAGPTVVVKAAAAEEVVVDFTLLDRASGMQEEEEAMAVHEEGRVMRKVAQEGLSKEVRGITGAEKLPMPIFINPVLTGAASEVGRAAAQRSAVMAASSHAARTMLGPGTPTGRKRCSNMAVMRRRKVRPPRRPAMPARRKVLRRMLLLLRPMQHPLALQVPRHPALRLIIKYLAPFSPVQPMRPRCGAVRCLAW